MTCLRFKMLSSCFRLVAALCLAGFLAACSLGTTASQETPTSIGTTPNYLPLAEGYPPAEAAATGAPESTVIVSSDATPLTLQPQAIILDSPPRLTLVGSPMVITGRTARLPQNQQLNYRILERDGTLLGEGVFPVNGEAGQPGSFSAELSFRLPQDGGIIRAEIFERSNVPAAVAAVQTLELAVDAQYQSISIDTPAPGTQVGSPVVLTGRTARGTADGTLGYRVFNSAERQIGAGSIPVSGPNGLPRSFVGEVFFDLPRNGDTIRVELFDQEYATSSISLFVAPLAQHVMIDTPPAGTLVGSPVVVTGRTARFPSSGTLAYRIFNANGDQIGGGTFPVSGQPGQGATFNASLVFQVPRDGGRIRVEIADLNADGSVNGAQAVELDVLAQYQAIRINTPAPGAQVGSPAVLTGDLNQFPSGRLLQYRVLDASGQQIGIGTLPVDGVVGGRGRFNASIYFSEPANGGNIRVILSDQNASAEITLYVAPPPKAQILIDTPPPGTQVGSPVVLTGRTTRYPAGGQLAYRIYNAQNAVIGSGNFEVVRNGGGSTFNASLMFTEPPTGGNITVELLELDPTNGSTLTSASIGLFVAPR